MGKLKRFRKRNREDRINRRMVLKLRGANNLDLTGIEAARIEATQEIDASIAREKAKKHA